MSEDGTTTETAPAPEAQPETFSLEYVQQLRSEAAKYRQDKKAAAAEAAERTAAEYQLKLDAAGDENADLQVQLATAVRDVQKYAAMIDQGIPVELMPKAFLLVQGHDPESIAESVAAVKELMGKTVRERAVDPLQGHGNAVALNSDDLENSLRRALGIN